MSRALFDVILGTRESFDDSPLVQHSVARVLLYKNIKALVLSSIANHTQLIELRHRGSSIAPTRLEQLRSGSLLRKQVSVARRLQGQWILENRNVATG